MLRIVLLGCATAALLGAMGAAGYVSWKTNSELRAAGDAFLSALRRGDVGRAYELLSPWRRAKTSRADFEQLVAHPAFHGSAHDLGRSKERGRSFPATAACTRGDLVTGGQEWAVQLYYVRGPAGWRIESFALQEPASTHLADLLEECGYSDDMLVGYSGPPVVNKTPPLD